VATAYTPVSPSNSPNSTLSNLHLYEYSEGGKLHVDLRGCHGESSADSTPSAASKVGQRGCGTSPFGLLQKRDFPKRKCMNPMTSAVHLAAASLRL
jgi:hypothetical protein